MDLDRFRLNPQAPAAPRRGERPRTPRRCTLGARFLRGPVPWAWLAQAGNLPGHALHVALVLRLEAGIHPGQPVTLPRARLTEIGVSRFALYRALEQLEGAGLVAVERGRGRGARVTILAPDPTPQETSP